PLCVGRRRRRGLDHGLRRRGLGGGLVAGARHGARRRGLGLDLALGHALVRADHHDHVPAVLLRLGLDETELGYVVRELLQQPEAELGTGLLATAEHDRHLDLVPRLEEPLDVALLGAVVVRVDLRAELDLLDDGLRLVLARLPRLERGLVLELPVVHELTDRGPRSRGNLDKIEVSLLREPERLVDRDDPYLLALRADKPDFRRADPIVDTRVDADVTSTGSSCSATASCSGDGLCLPAVLAPPAAACRDRRQTRKAPPGACAAGLPLRGRCPPASLAFAPHRTRRP